MTYNRAPSRSRFGGTRISLKNSRDTVKGLVDAQSHRYGWREESDSRLHILLIPFSVPPVIFPRMISPLNGRNTIIRNLTIIPR